METTLAFDVYGTLIDPHGVVTELQKMIGEKAEQFSNTWRNKQLEYSFRRGLMQNYENFAVCTRDALEFTCAFHKLPLEEKQKNILLEAYRTLPAYDDVKSSLKRLKQSNYRIFAFSNGTRDALEVLLTHAEIRDLFEDVISVDDIKSFKPNPAVYAHFLRSSGSPGHPAWLISCNPFDVIGAISTGMHAAWVKRSDDAVFDPWGIEQTAMVKNLIELADYFETTSLS